MPKRRNICIIAQKVRLGKRTCSCRLRQVKYLEVDLSHCASTLKGRRVEEIGKRRGSWKGICTEVETIYITVLNVFSMLIVISTNNSLPII